MAEDGVPIIGNHTMKTIIKQTAPGNNRLVDFGLTDAKGRKIGVIVCTYSLEVAEAPQDWKGCFYDHLEVGQVIGVRIDASRDNCTFGACQPCQYFKTQAEADAAIAKRVKSTRARYAKQFPQS
jgi:hypothetical protein